LDVERGQNVRRRRRVPVAVRQRPELLKATGDGRSEAALAADVGAHEQVARRLGLVAAVGAAQLLHLYAEAAAAAKSEWEEAVGKGSLQLRRLERDMTSPEASELKGYHLFVLLPTVLSALHASSMVMCTRSLWFFLLLSACRLIPVEAASEMMAI